MFDSWRGQKLLTTLSRPPLEPAQPSILCVPGALSAGINWPGRDPTACLNIGPTLRKLEAIPQLPYT
jgi:hypothetical protein